MDPILERAFRLASYRIADRQGDWWLEPDRPCSQLSLLLAHGGHACASLISAANPAASLLSPEENEHRQSRLRMRVESMGFSYLDGENSALDGSWREPTLLCLGMDLPIALDLAGEFGQVAILHSGADAVPRLRSCPAEA